MWVSDSYEDIQQRARNELNRGNYDAALADYQRLAERLGRLKPAVRQRRPELQQLYALSLAQQASLLHWRGEFAQALDLYQQLIQLNPQNAPLWRRLAALVHIDMGQVETGLDELRASAVAAPGDALLWVNIAQECEGLGRLDEAEENYRRALANAGTPEAKKEVQLARFDFYRAQGRVDEAMAAWDAAWQAADNGRPDYVFPVYQMYWENDDHEQAYAYLEREKNPLRRGFYYGWFAHLEGDEETADKQWRKVVKLNPTKEDEGHDAWAEAALRIDTPPALILSILNAVQEAGAMTLRGLLLLAVTRARMGDAESTRGVLEAARNVGLRSRPREEQLPLSNWELFDELVADQAIKQSVRDLFEPQES